MAKYRRTARQEFPSTDPTRRGQTDVMYVYMDDHFQTYSFRIPLEEDNEENVKAALRSRAETAARAGPLEIEV